MAESRPSKPLVAGSNPVSRFMICIKVPNLQRRFVRGKSRLPLYDLHKNIALFQQFGLSVRVFPAFFQMRDSHH